MSKYYDPSVWRSAMRSSRNIKDITDANVWDYFCTLTWPEEISRDYYTVKKHALAWKRDIEREGGKVLLVIGFGEKGGLYHVHALVYQMPQDMIAPGAVYAGLIKVKTHGRLWTLRNAAKYDVGLHVVQTIGTQDDVNHIGDYIARHVYVMRDMFEMGILAGIIDKTVHLYYATRGLARSKRGRMWVYKVHDAAERRQIASNYDLDHYEEYRRYENAIYWTIRLFDNKIQKDAVILPKKIAHLVLDYISAAKVEYYCAKGKRHTPMCRIVGKLQDMVAAIQLSTWCPD